MGRIGQKPWNKGIKSGIPLWNKGLTKETSPIIAKLSKSLSGRKIEWASKISEGNKRFYANGGVNGFKVRWEENPDFMRKENNPNWKGGKSRAYKTGYYSPEYKKWRKSVFERDGYHCRSCGSTGYLTSHHIKSFAFFPDLRFDIENGLTLCEPCHSKTDNYKGRAKMKSQ